MQYLLVDFANIYFRARHAASRGASPEEKVAMALHIALTSVNAMAKRFNPDHVVWCLEGRSWRKDYYEPYKRNRKELRDSMTFSQAEEDELFWNSYNDLTSYLVEHTNCSVLRCPIAEGDDIVARWITLHPADDHIIVSSDTDFVQLLAANVKQYNGVMDELITLEGVFTSTGKPVVDKKTKQPKTVPNPEWLLFEKIIRGDSSDNIFSAYPGVRTNGSKNKVGLREAFEDRNKKGWAWNNLQLQRWVDHEGIEHRVIDDYERNRVLIDLTAQPDDIKQAVDRCIRESVNIESRGQVGVRFLKFCGKHNLVRLSEQAENFSKWMCKTYSGELNDSHC